MRQRLGIVLGGSIWLAGCPMGRSPSSFGGAGSEATASSTAATTTLAPALAVDDGGVKKEQPIIVRRERGNPLEVFPDKVEVKDDGSALTVTIASDGVTLAKDLPLSDVGGVPLEPNTEYVVQVADSSDPARPELVDQIVVVTPARAPEVVSVESLEGDRLLVGIDLRDNPPGTPVALGVAAPGMQEPDFLIDPRTGSPLPAGADPFLEAKDTDLDTLVDEQVAEGATVGVELGATVGGLDDRGIEPSSDAAAAMTSLEGDGGIVAGSDARGTESSVGAPEATTPAGSDSGIIGESDLWLIVSLPSNSGSVGITVQAQNDQGVATGWSELVLTGSAPEDPSTSAEKAEDAQDDAAAVAAIADATVEEADATSAASQTALTSAPAPGPNASAGEMLAWLRARIQEVRAELADVRAALKAASRDLKRTRAELRAAKLEHAWLDGRTDKKSGKGKHSTADASLLAAADAAILAAKDALDDAERRAADLKLRRETVRRTLGELIDELRARRSALIKQ